MDTANGYFDATPRDYARALFRQKGVVITTFLVVTATAVAAAWLQTPVYEAKVKMLVSGRKQAQAEYYADMAMGGLRSAQVTMTQSQIAASDPVLERAVAVLGLAKKPLDYEKRFASKLKRPLVNLRALRIEKKLASLSP